MENLLPNFVKLSSGHQFSITFSNYISTVTLLYLDIFSQRQRTIENNFLNRSFENKQKKNTVIIYTVQNHQRRKLNAPLNTTVSTDDRRTRTQLCQSHGTNESVPRCLEIAWQISLVSLHWISGNIRRRTWRWSSCRNPQTREIYRV